MTEAIAQINDRADTISAESKRLTKEDAKAPIFASIPRVVPFVDWDFYYLDGALEWKPNPGQKLVSVKVPKGFVTDLASVPSILWAKYPPMGRYAYAAIVHDYLYWEQSTSRADADQIFKVAMKDAGVDSATMSDFHIALRTLGGLAWNNNAKMKAAGEKRVLARFPADPLTSWEAWKQMPNVFER